MQAVIGIEVHAQLATRTKAFCGCELVAPSAPPNSAVCPICLGWPGAMPRYNAQALQLALRGALALGCAPEPCSEFARKQYFYADLPKGYQISQAERPLARHGALHFEFEGQVRCVQIARLHLEEDAGKLLHELDGRSGVDLNRAGTPLAEIVSEPDLRSGAEAAAYLRELRKRLLFAGVCDGDLEQGNFRADVNISLRADEHAPLGTRVELKNLNSFRFVERAVHVEVERQRALLSRGEAVRQETRGYDDRRGETFALRGKEEAADYRYFPEPDLPQLQLSSSEIQQARAALPSLPDALRAQWREAHGVGDEVLEVLTSHPAIAALFEQSLAHGAPPLRSANFIASELVRDVQLDGLRARLPISAAQLADLLSLVEAKRISLGQAKELYAELHAAGPQGAALRASAWVSARNLGQLDDEQALVAMARELLTKHPKEVAGYRAGRTLLLGFFVGQIMKATERRANAERASQVLKALLDGAEE